MRFYYYECHKRSETGSHFFDHHPLLSNYFIMDFFVSHLNFNEFFFVDRIFEKKKNNEIENSRKSGIFLNN